VGYHSFDDRRQNYTYGDLDGQHSLASRAASMLARKGIVLVNSAGNDGMGTWKKVNVPGDAHDILTVGAVTPRGMNAPFSSIGPTADGRVKPDVMAQGSPTAVISGRGTIIHQTGTSFSTPLVTGLVACLWQALPSKTAMELIDLVRRSASQYEHPDNIYGYGIPKFWRAYMLGKANANAR
jgi:subtilisin family serine protease